AEQARQVFRNMELCLTAAGCGFDDVVKVVHYLLDVDDRPKINPVRMEFFGEARPASTLVEVAALAVPGALLEIEAVAAIPNWPASCRSRNRRSASPGSRSSARRYASCASGSRPARRRRPPRAEW